MPAVLTGQPARNAICRAMLKPVAPSGLAHPMITSSISPGSRPARSMAALTTWPPSVAPCVRLNAPRQDLVSAVRAVDTMTASTTGFSSGAFAGCGPVDGGVETAALGRQLRDEFRRLPERRIGVRIARELAHAPGYLAEPDAAGMEHRATALHREAVAAEVDHVDVRS